MSQRTSYRQGTPNWVDLQTADEPAAKSFYGELLGWTYDENPMPEGSYNMAIVGDGVAAAIAPQSPEMRAAGAPPTWNTYLAVDDVDTATGKVEAAGGRVLMAPFDVMEAGRMSFVADPTGAQVILWQAKNHIGATVVNEPGAIIWNELITDDKDKALAFYGAVLGTGTETSQLGDMPYTGITVDGEMIAGTADTPDGEPNQWRVYFDVPSTSAAVKRAVELGGTVIDEPITVPIGSFATIRDPQGGVFGVFSNPE
ncbi:MAG TPA: VOC family protein [Pseudonocardiaceae bacterium]|nr:VOC family protein [Pseudonocardiaceae bacterium]